MPKLAVINIYPCKSLDALRLDRCAVLAGGALENDRRFALCDRTGEFINGKNTPRVHTLRSVFDPSFHRITLVDERSGESQAFDIEAERPALIDWLSRYFEMPVDIIENAAAGFPDDNEAPGPTVISTGTLREVASWFPGITLEQARARFRANLEIDADEPFWEDRLFAERDVPIRFRVGEAELLGTNPCARCVVPSRDPQSGEPIREFARLFARRRQETLPVWAAADRFDHFYRLAVNTRPARAVHCEVRVGDTVTIVGPT